MEILWLQIKMKSEKFYKHHKNKQCTIRFKRMFFFLQEQEDMLNTFKPGTRLDFESCEHVLFVSDGKRRCSFETHCTLPIFKVFIRSF